MASKSAKIGVEKGAICEEYGGHSDDDGRHWLPLAIPQDCPFYQTIHPIVVYGQMTGVCYIVTDKRQWLRPLLIVMSIVNTVTIGAFVIRLMTLIDLNNEGLNPITLIKLATLSWVVFALLSAISNWHIQCHLNGLIAILASDTACGHSGDIVVTKQRWQTIRNYLYLIIPIVTATFNASIVALIKYNAIPFDYVPTVIDNTNTSIWADIVVGFVTDNTITYGCIFMMALCTFFRSAVIELAQAMSKGERIKSIESSSIDDLSLIAHYHQRYQVIFECVQYLDSMFKWFCAMAFGFFVPTLTLAIFIYVKAKNRESVNIVFVWMMNLTVKIVLIFIPCLLLYEQTETLMASLYRVYRRTFKMCGGELLNEVQLFAAQLSTTRLAITAGGFFNINKELIIALVSAIVTYFVIMLEFDSNNGTKVTLLNCTCDS